MVDIFIKGIHVEPSVFCVKFVQDFNQSRDHDRSMSSKNQLKFWASAFNNPAGLPSSRVEHNLLLQRRWQEQEYRYAYTTKPFN